MEKDRSRFIAATVPYYELLFQLTLLSSSKIRLSVSVGNSGFLSTTVYLFLSIMYLYFQNPAATEFANALKR